MAELRRTGLFDLHVELGARLVPFAGWEMPVQYPLGVLKEHQHCRQKAGLFDVSHMGQVIVPLSAIEALEALIPVSIAGLAQGRQRYGFFTNDAGGILDDLMIARKSDHLFLVVNAGCAQADIDHLRAHLPQVTVIEDRALIALQGPSAVAALSRHVPDVAQMRFMDVAEFTWSGVTLWVSRSGYTGEDGYEISVPDAHAEGFVRALLNEPEVEMIGLGARDSLRLEAGLCLYGHDIDTQTSPVEAGLAWAIQKPRRTGGAREGGFPGADRILAELDNGPARMRMGLRPETRAPMREGVMLYAEAEGGAPIGTVTSGGFGPSINAPMAMAYLPADTAVGTMLFGEVRGKRLPCSVAALPFHPHSYKR
ncbi:glycine cleavage system protein T [Thioclava sp. SK-1]|uniref:glycine cleavage system aminomethyltransferase GcvT n=1 Tax=Thioclava sp. SK-1 TaxID=1889770 RepID=UPI0008261231|nr:glycine cleavage system aminomethyltransferase GcvT [Thioclava sp. SK-1]OCX61100.1 glycine cleavage system protein T [Thioclava sp. SK-1]